MSPFERLLVALVKGRVRFAHVRATQDLDILVSAEPDNVRRLVAVLEGFGEGRARELAIADFTLEPAAIRTVEDFPLDVFTLLAVKKLEDLEEHVKLWDGGTEPIPFLDAQGLIEIKSQSLREQDLLDALALRSLLTAGP